MQIKDIIKMAALMINRKEIIDYLDGNVQNVGVETSTQVDSMVGLANLVINELATTYIPMIKTKSISSVGGKIYYSRLEDKILKIRSVYLKDGTSVNFTQMPEYILLNHVTVDVEYEYSPPTYSIDQEIGYMEKDVPARVIAYGLLAELAISEGRLDDAVAFHKRYAASVELLCLPKNSKIKQRSWV
ncbi:MAG: hypothetical protein E7348_00175 [Clostridiales bacterium]|nr:hypothetical protein [Clostridiales bacterium]